MEHVTRRIGLWTAWLVLLFSVVPVSLAAQPQTGSVAPEARVAVLPFQVNSAKPLGYLESSLADLLMSRLEASGQVQVVESQAVRDKTVAFAGERSDATVRRIARELAADQIVAGSLTELAGRYSLDVKVVPAGTTRRPRARWSSPRRASRSSSTA